MKTSDNHCLVTVTTESYAQWSMTMIFSFLKSNDWFKGDVIVICDELSENTKGRFGIFPQLKFVKPSDRLIENVINLSNHIPGFKGIASMFYSLELFNFTGYKKVLFLDSDILVVKSVKEIFEHDKPFIASAESCWYSGKVRKTDTYEAVNNWTDDAMVIKNPVNSGFMVIDEQFINEKNYRELISQIVPELWINKTTFHADQLIINLFFNNKITLVDARYNYRPTNAYEILDRDHVSFEEAKIIHYFRQFKPWNFKEVFELSQHDMVHLKAFKLWYAYYVEFLKHFHLQLKINYHLKNEQTNS